MKLPLMLVGMIFIALHWPANASAQRHVFNRANKAWLVRYHDADADVSRYGDKAIRIKIEDVPKPASGNTVITARLQRFIVDNSTGTPRYLERAGNEGDITLGGVIYSDDPEATNHARKRVKFVVAGSYLKASATGELITVSVRVWGIHDTGKIRKTGGGAGSAHKDDDVLAIRLVIEESPLSGFWAAPTPVMARAPTASGSNLIPAPAPGDGPCPEEPDVDVLEEEDAMDMDDPPAFDSMP